MLIGANASGVPASGILRPTRGPRQGILELRRARNMITW